MNHRIVNLTPHTINVWSATPLEIGVLDDHADGGNHTITKFAAWDVAAIREFIAAQDMPCVAWRGDEDLAWDFVPLDALDSLLAEAFSVVVAPSGELARVAERRVDLEPLSIDGVHVPVSVAEYGDVTGLPPRAEGVIYVVSGLVLAALRAAGSDREDVFAPGPAIRDGAGKIVGAQGLSALHGAAADPAPVDPAPEDPTEPNAHAPRSGVWLLDVLPVDSSNPSRMDAVRALRQVLYAVKPPEHRYSLLKDAMDIMLEVASGTPYFLRWEISADQVARLRVNGWGTINED